jgi:WD40 repeat protein
MRLATKNYRALTLVPLICASAALNLPAQETPPTQGQKTAAAPAESGPWLSSIAWMDNAQLVATKSEGLLLRPAQVVKLAAADTAKLEIVGEQETSLWSVLPLDATRYAVTDYKGGVYLYGEGDPKKFELDARWVRATAKAPGDTEILAGTEDGKLVVLAIAEKKEARRIDAQAAAIFDIAFNHKGDQVATAAGDGTIKIFSWPKLEPVATMSRGKDAIWCVAFSDDDSQLISGGADRRIQLWDVAKAKSVMTLQMTSDWITSLVPLPGTTAIAAASMNGKVFLVDYKSMRPISHSDVAKSAIWSMALSPDGSQVAIATRKHGASVIAIAPWVEAAKQAASGEAALEAAPAPVKK